MDANHEIAELRQALEEILESISRLSDKQNSQYTDLMLLLKKIVEQLENDDAEHVDLDDYYEQATEIVIEAGKASTSYLQRKLGIGYSTAAALMDMLEENNVIGPPNGSKPREVLIKEGE